MVVGVDVVTEGHDQGQLAPMVERIKESLRDEWAGYAAKSAGNPSCHEFVNEIAD
ncbi:MAG: hypothetical protein ACHBMF_06165 [Chromatiales bacterium]